MKKSKLTLQRNAIRVLGNGEAAQAAGGKQRNPFDNTIHSHLVPCRSGFDSFCFTHTDVLTAP